MSDSMENFIKTQTSATLTLLGVVAYLCHELARSGTLNVHNFQRHLEDMDLPEGGSETNEERMMRKSIIDMMRNAASGGANDGSDT